MLSLMQVVDPAMIIGVATILAGISGVPGLLLRRVPAAGQKIAAWCVAIGSVLGSCGAILLILNGENRRYIVEWGLPIGRCELLLDPLSALFLLPIFVISACSAVYARSYWPAEHNPTTEPRLTFFFGLLTAAMAGVVTAASGVLFLMSWEIMALSAYFVLTTVHSKAEVREAGTLYLITTHIGTLALFALFSLLHKNSGLSYGFPPPNSLEGSSTAAAGIFIAALIGFGLKAGLMPLHIWLPSAHANAPTHISALMSGVLIKTGIYGIIRTVSFFHHIPPWWGATVLIAGMISGVLGVAFAIGQHDLKRLLAYHSIENIGIIAIGIGVALIGRSAEVPTLALLGITGALLHVMNHAIFKSLLFFSAGAVIHSTGTREIDLMGGVFRRAPYTATAFLLGAVAICGLPPLNGFVSEFLIYLGLFTGMKQGGGTGIPFLALAAPALALIGGLAVACFIKVYGIAFLGLPRSRQAEAAHECGWAMGAPMLLLGSLCILIGLFPFTLLEVLQRAATSWYPELASGATRLATAAPLGWLTAVNCVLLVLSAAIGTLFLRQLKATKVEGGITWDCGYLKPAPSMQYTASSFGDMLVSLFNGVLRPHRARPKLKGTFPPRTHFGSHVPETVLDLIYLPFLKRMNSAMSIVRRLQHGQLHLYILYTFITLVTLLVWSH